MSANNIPALSGSTNTNGWHEHNIQFRGNNAWTTGVSGTAAGSAKWLPAAPKGYGNEGLEFYAVGNGNHSHTVTINGKDEPFSILPPYEVAYIWERIS